MDRVQPLFFQRTEHGAVLLQASCSAEFRLLDLEPADDNPVHQEVFEWRGSWSSQLGFHQCCLPCQDFLCDQIVTSNHSQPGAFDLGCQTLHMFPESWGVIQEGPK